MHGAGTWLLAALAVVGLLPGGARSDVRAAEEPEIVTFSGLIVGPDGAPVPDAVVEAHRLEYSEDEGFTKPVDVLRADAGRFTYALPAVPGRWPARVSFYIRADGLALFRLGWLRNADGEATVTLPRAARLAGTVVDEAGRPVPGAEVRALLQTPKCTRRSDADDQPRIEGLPPFRGLTVKTDADGRFAFANIPPDAGAELIVSAPGLATIQTGPNSRRPLDFQFAAGQEDIRVVLPPEAVIRGVAVEAGTGKPVEGLVVLVAGPVRLGSRCVTGRDGTFELTGVGVGKLALRVPVPLHDRPGWVVPYTPVEVEPGQVLEDFKIVCHRGGVLSVKVIDAISRKPLDSAKVTGYEENRKGYIYGTTRAEGVHNEHLQPGAYRLKVEKLGYRGFFEQEIQVEAAKTHRLVAELMPPPEVTGIVLDPAGRPVEHAFVQIHLLASGVFTDEEGRFELTVSGHTWESDHEFTLQATHEERKLSAIYDLVGGPQTLQVTIHPYRTIRGRIVDTKGRPVRQARVNLHWRRKTRTGKTDDEGRYEFGGLPLPCPDRTFRMEVQAAEHLPAARDMPIARADGELVALGDVVLELVPPSVSGVVVNPAGEPVVNVLVEAYSEALPPMAGRTDARGRFTITDLREGKVWLYMPECPARDEVEVEAGARNVRLEYWGEGHTRLPIRGSGRLP